jgi:hypothetical protein
MAQSHGPKVVHPSRMGNPPGEFAFCRPEPKAAIVAVKQKS